MYKQLLLSAGGGIISNEQKEKQGNCVTLAIGLGGTGISCLSNLKRMVYERLQADNPEDLVPTYSQIKFLAIDTDCQLLQTVGKINSPEGYAEIFDLSNPNIDGLLSDASIAPEYQWLKIATSEKGEPSQRLRSLTEGTGGVRQIGRLMIISKSDAFVNKVIQLIEEAKRGFSYGVDVNIHIFSGVGGGTGSGIFLDVCYLVQKALYDIGEGGHAVTHGYFFLPDVNLSIPSIAANPIVSSYIMANGYAAMKELDYCMNFETNGGEWSQQYRGFQVGPIKTQPVDFCYLISEHTLKGSLFEKGFFHAMDVVGEYVLHFLVHNDIDMRENLAYYSAAASLSNEQGDNYRYILLGSSNAIVPKREITTYLASKMFMAVSNLGSRYPSDGEIKQFAKENTLHFEGLLEQVMNGTSYKMPVIELEASMFRDMPEGDLLTTDLILPDTIIRPYRDIQFRISAIVDQNIHALTQEWKRNEIQENRGNISKVWQLFFALERIAEDPKRGPIYALTILNGTGRQNLIEILNSNLKFILEQVKKSQDDRSFRVKAVKETRSAYLHPGFLQNRQRLFNTFMAAVAEYFEYDSMRIVFEKMLNMTRIIREQFIELYRGYFAPYENVYSELIETFRENYSAMSHDAEFMALNDSSVMYLPRFDSKMKGLLDDVVEQIDLEQEVKRFNETFFRADSSWINEEENKIVKFVSDFVKNVYDKYIQKSINDYLEIHFNTKDQVILQRKILVDILQPLNDMASPLFWKDPVYDSTGVSVGYISVPDHSAIITEAANRLTYENPEIKLLRTSLADRIQIIRCIYGIPMSEYNGLGTYYEIYKSDSAVGRHLYEYTERDPRDWRKLPNLLSDGMPDDDYKVISEVDDRTTEALPAELDRQLSTLINGYFEEEGNSNLPYSRFFEYVNENCSNELKPHIPSRMGFLFSIDEGTSELRPAHTPDVQELLYQLYLLDSRRLVIPQAIDEIMDQNILSETEQILRESTEKDSSDQQSQESESKYDPLPEALEQATYYVIKAFEKWLSEKKLREGTVFDISKHARQQPSGLQYGYDVGMNASDGTIQFRLCFECKCYSKLKRSSETEKVNSIKIASYSNNLLQYFMHCSPDYNNRWILVCPFGDLQADFQELLFDHWNRTHDYLQIIAITEEQSWITCREFLSVDEKAYNLIYHDSDDMTYPKREKEEIFQSLYDHIIGDDLVEESIRNTLLDYSINENGFLDCNTILEVQTSDGFNAMERALELLSGIELKRDKSAPSSYGVYIIGEYGTGKTWLAYRIIEQIVRHRGLYLFVPVLVRMKDIIGALERRKLSSSKNATLEAQKIVKEYFQKSIYSNMSGRYRRCKAFLFILDGLDEVLSGFSYTTGKIDILSATITELRQRYPSSLFVVTSRESDYNACKKHNYFKAIVSQFHLIELQQFKADDVINSINKQAEGCERDKDHLHQLAANEKFVRIMQTPVFFNFMLNLVERPALLRMSKENEEIDKYTILAQIVSLAFEKLDHNPDTMERVYNCALKSTRYNLQEVPYSIISDSEIEISDSTISKFVPTDIMNVRSISDSECALGFKHNIIREFLVAQQLHKLLLDYCSEDKTDIANNDFCQTLKDLPMTVETQHLFIKCIQEDEENKECCFSALKAMVSNSKNKKSALLSTKLLELLLQPDFGIEGETGKCFNLSGIRINNLYIWRSYLKHVNLRNAHIKGLQLVDAELCDVDLNGAEVSNLHMCTDDRIQCVTHNKNGAGYTIIVVFLSGQVLQYDFQSINNPTQYTVKILNNFRQAPYLNVFFTNSDLVIHTNREIYLGDQKTAIPIYKLTGEYNLERICYDNDGNVFIISNVEGMSALIYTKDSIEKRVLGGINLRLLCSVSGTEYCIAQNNKLCYRKGENELVIAPWEQQDLCFTAHKDDGVLTVIILRIGRLLGILYSEEEGQTTQFELVVDKEIPFQTIEWITENTFLAANEDAAYILRIVEGKCYTTELEFRVRCKALELGDKPGEKRLQDDAAYQMLKAAMRE